MNDVSVSLNIGLEHRMAHAQKSVVLAAFQLVTAKPGVSSSADVQSNIAVLSYVNTNDRMTAPASTTSE